MLCAGGDGSAALLIKDREPGSAEPTTAVSFPRAPFSTVAEHPSYRKEHDCYSKQKYSLQHWKLHLQVKYAVFCKVEKIPGGEQQPSQPEGRGIQLPIHEGAGLQGPITFPHRLCSSNRENSRILL